MSRFVSMAAVAAALAALPLSAVAAQRSEAERVEASRAVVEEFMTSLKQQLQHAIKEGGPPHAVAVCNTIAPEIASKQSQRTGWRVGRTSLKVRNPDNAPDDWERKTLLVFEERKAAGEDIRKLETYGFAEEDGNPVFRYMKAIPTAELCLACHGTEIDPAVSTTLKKHYPLDQATGFRAGDIRGAFTISQPN